MCTFILYRVTDAYRVEVLFPVFQKGRKIHAKGICGTSLNCPPVPWCVCIYFRGADDVGNNNLISMSYSDELVSYLENMNII